MSASLDFSTASCESLRLGRGLPHAALKGLWFALLCWPLLPLPAQQQAVFSQPVAERSPRAPRKYDYLLGADMGLLLGFNGPQLRRNADQRASNLGSVYKMGDFLRYGLSSSLYFGISWRLGTDAGNRQASASGWGLGLQLRVHFSVGETVSTYFNKRLSVGNFYSQQDLRNFLAFQPALQLYYLFSPTWRLELILGPSLNWNFYLHYREEYTLANIRLEDRTVAGSQKSELLGPITPGAIVGISLAHYYYDFLGMGASVQYLLNVSPQSGKYSLGQFVFGLHLHFIW